MGSYCELKFDGWAVCENKSVVPDDFTALFQEDDRVERHESDDDDEELPAITYEISRDVMLKRLSLLGATEQVARSEFEAWLLQERDTWTGYEKKGDWAGPTSGALASLRFEGWRQRVPVVLATRYQSDYTSKEPADAIDRHFRKDDEGWLWFAGYGSHVSLRALLDACSGVEKVILDIASLVGGGYIQEDEPICEVARNAEPHFLRPLAPTVVLAEGSTDITILRLSLNAMYPEVRSYFSFFDHEELRVDGGTSYLVKFLKAFAAARAPFRMIALFDNDTAGVFAHKQATALGLPSNMIIIRLPDSEIALAYPTIGPQGEHVMDVNGQAAGIELYLGEDALRHQGSLRKVRWTGYEKAAAAYQGEVEGKSDIFASFRRQIDAQGDPASARATFPDLANVWQCIFGEVERRAALDLQRHQNSFPSEH